MREMKQGIPGGRKKVLFVITKSNWGGAQRYVYDLATHLPKDQFEPIVALGGTGAPDAATGLLKEKLDQAGIPTILVKSFVRDVAIIKEFSVLWELIQIMRRERPDVVHLNSSKAGAIGAVVARIAGINNIVFTSHGLAWDEDRNLLARALIYILSRITFLLCHSVITISKDNYDRARACFLCRNKIYLIHNGLSPFTPLSRDDARSKLFSAQDIEAHQNDTWVVSTGELTDNKNYMVALESVAQYNATHEKKIFYSIVGEGEMRAAVAARISELHLEQSVKLLGFVADARTHLSAFDIFFMPSKKEGLPYALLEAGQSGLLVIASKVGGIPDVITDGVNGFLRGCSDVEGFAKALSLLTTNEILRLDMGKKLNDKITRNYNLKSMVEQTIELY
jgi:glycosyltransferase involved in cell wall biosynthesis